MAALEPSPPGATVEASGVSYRVWGPELDRLALRTHRSGREARVALTRDEAGWWSGRDPGGRAGDWYAYEFPDGALRPDPRSRFQPAGVSGASEVIDPTSYAWASTGWERPAWSGQTLYELHVGTFTQAGTFAAATERLGELRALGVEAVELMPVADFPGDRGWGYDGVALYAPARCYGRPDELRALVDAAHGHGLAVILDVVYNHLGPAGNHLPCYARDYFGEDTRWGRGFKLEGPRAGPVRAFLVDNALAWLDEYRFDGLRLDATHAIVDPSPRHVLEEVIDAAHGRGAFVILEDDRNDARLLEGRAAGGLGADAAWADDFHHLVHVALTGEQHGYYANYSGSTAQLVDALEHGWAYRGQTYPTWQRPRGTAARHLPASAFVLCTENHDQAGNRARGERLHHLVSAAHVRAAAVLLCLSPYAPMLFMGQEWACSAPFLYFTDHDEALGQQIREGRAREFGHLETADPQASDTFQRSKLDWRERSAGRADHLALHRDALRLRQQLKAGPFTRDHWRIEAVGEALALRLEQGARCWLVLVGLRGTAQDLSGPLLIPPEGRRWRAVLDTEDPRYGGTGAALELTTFSGPRAAVFEAREGLAHAPA